MRNWHRRLRASVEVIAVAPQASLCSLISGTSSPLRARDRHSRSCDPDLSNLRLRAELEQCFIAIKHEFLIPGVQLGSERTLAGQEEMFIDRVFNLCIFIPLSTLIDEAVDDVRTQR